VRDGCATAKFVHESTEEPAVESAEEPPPLARAPALRYGGPGMQESTVPTRLEASASPATPLLPRLLALSWPVVIARASQSVIGFTDALLVAPLGEEALAAVTTGAFNTFAFIILPMGTSFILQSFAAQLRGRGELGAVRRFAWYGLVLAIVAAGTALAAIPLVPLALHRLGYAPGVEHAMSTYMSIRFLSVGAVVGAEALGNWFGGLGNTRVAMVSGATAMIVNVAGCYALIEPRFGLPGFGVAGAGWASVAGSFSGFAVALAAFFRDRAAGSGASGRLRWHEFTRVLRFGLPNGANWFLEFGAFALFVNLVAGSLGTTVLAAFNVVIQVNSISFMPAWGVSTAGAILVGEAIGRRAEREVWPIVRLTGVVAIGWMVAVGTLYFAEPIAFFRLFSSHGSEGLLAVGGVMLQLAAVWQLFDGIGITVSEALRAAGDTTWTMVARIVLAWGVFVPLAWVSVRSWGGGVVTLMLVLVVYIALLAAALAWRFASGRWRDIRLVEVDVDDVLQGEPSVVGD
jgi:MATE family multidrug resistance protein